MLKTRLIALPLALVAVAACSDTTASGRTPLNLSISTKPSSSPVLSLNPDLIVTSGGNSLSISKAEVVFSKVELKSTSTSTCTSGAEDCSEMELNPMLVNLPIDGVTPLDLGALVPAGSYSELSFKVDAVTSGEGSAAAAFLAAHPDFAGKSVHVEGTYNGQAFTFDSNQGSELELELAQAVTVGGSGASNVTIAIDLASWFKDASGALVNPADPANASAINDNIKRSFHAFEDDNEDGVEDHR